MGKQPKGFGKPIQPKGKHAKKQPKSKRIELHPLPDSDFLWEKESRLRQIFTDEDKIPSISSTSLQQYHQSLQATLDPGLLLDIREPLAWEEIFIYGPETSLNHNNQRRQNPSYLDQYQLIALESWMEVETGIQAKIQRISDQQTFTLPLYHFQVYQSETPKQLVNASDDQPQSQRIADYCFWWEQYRPHWF